MSIFKPTKEDRKTQKRNYLTYLWKKNIDRTYSISPAESKFLRQEIGKHGFDNFGD